MGLGFLGAGKMATALATAWKEAGMAEAANCLASDVSDSARQMFTAASGFPTTSTNKEVLSHCQTIIVAVKPQVIPGLLEEIRSRVKPEHLFISIVAGVKIETLTQGLGTHRVIRVMPNTPCLVGESATAYSSGHGVKAEDDELAGRLFAAVGKAFPVPESYLNAVTGLSGSGPAFIYLLIEALSDGGVRAGLPRDLASSLAAQTVLGAAKMVLETGEHPAQLKDMVASPGGTTIAGLHALEKAGFRGALIDAVLAATQRAKELGS